MNYEFRITNLRLHYQFKIQNSKIPNRRAKPENNSKFKIQNSKSQGEAREQFKIPNSKFKIQNRRAKPENNS